MRVDKLAIPVADMVEATPILIIWCESSTSRAAPISVRVSKQWESPGMRLGRRADIVKIIAVCEAAAAGDMEARVIGVSAGDEARLAQAVNALIDRTDAYLRESASSIDYVSRQKYHRRFSERGMVGAFAAAARGVNAATAMIRARAEGFVEAVRGFEARAAQDVAAVTQAAQGLGDVAGGLDDAARAARGEADAAVAATTRSADQARAVAAATAELTGSIQAVGAQAAQGAGNAADGNDAAAQAEAIHARIDGLTTAVREIADIAGVINDIAEQTNLLALNATIESARAGEAGRGFAVVAAEVKALAGETADATKRIDARIQAVQGAADEVADTVTGLAGAIERLDQLSRSVADAVADQTRATAEIAENAAGAAAGAEEAVDRLKSLAGAVRRAETDAGQVRATASDIAGASARLDKAANAFLSSARAAV